VVPESVGQVVPRDANMGGCECKDSHMPSDFDGVNVEESMDPGPAFMVKVVGARNVRGPDWFPGVCKSDCFCVVTSMQRGEVLFKTKISKNEVEPSWKEEFRLKETVQANGGLAFAIWHTIYSIDPTVTLPEGTEDRLVGMARLVTSRLSLAGFNGELELEHCGKDIAGATIHVKVGLVGQDYPLPPPPEFHITIENRTAKSLGIELDTQDENAVYVDQVRPFGLVDLHNSNSKPTERLLSEHFIMQVNGVHGKASELVEELNKLSVLHLVVRRPSVFCVAVDKKDKKRDIGFSFNTRSCSLVINQMWQGPVVEWNRRNPGKDVLLGDRIVAVNGLKGRASDMAKKMKSLDKFIMTVVRKHDDEEEWCW